LRVVLVAQAFDVRTLKEQAQVVYAFHLVVHFGHQPLTARLRAERFLTRDLLPEPSPSSRAVQSLVSIEVQCMSVPAAVLKAPSARAGRLRATRDSTGAG
jgi:hypothetical protein